MSSIPNSSAFIAPSTLLQPSKATLIKNGRTYPPPWEPVAEYGLTEHEEDRVMVPTRVPDLMVDINVRRWAIRRYTAHASFVRCTMANALPVIAYLATHGTIWRGSRYDVADYPADLQRPKRCYDNAFDLIENYSGSLLGGRTGSRLRYAEGLSCRGGNDYWVMHGWCLDDDDQVIDPTWGENPAALYIGFPLGPDTKPWAYRGYNHPYFPPAGFPKRWQTRLNDLMPDSVEVAASEGKWQLLPCNACGEYRPHFRYDLSRCMRCQPATSSVDAVVARLATRP